MKGIILDSKALNPGDLSWDVLVRLADFEIFESTPAEDVITRCADKDIVITNKVVFDKKTIDSLPNLKYIGVTATGYNIIDTNAAAEKGIAVTNIPAYSTDAVAQHVLAFILNLANRVCQHDESVKRGDWEKSDCFCYWLYPLFELSGKRLGIVGLGNIGKKVASLASAFGMDVCAFSPHSHMEGVKSVSMDELLSSSDIITLHCPLTDGTRHMMNSESLEKMKKGSILINASRGPLVDEDAVIAALECGHLSYYCADVLDREPPVNDKLAHHPRSVITPHIAWAPLETRKRLMNIAADNLSAFIRGEKLNRIV